MRSLITVVVALVAACSSPPADQGPVTEQVTGVITEVERGDGGDIVAFTVEESQSYRILIDPARDYGFDLEHLVEHRTTGDPVAVTTEQRHGGAYAVEIIDA